MTEKISLYYKQGGSDKVYQVTIEEKYEGFVVNYAFGRRGSTLAAGTKTDSPVQASAAKKIFDNLVKAKMAKGYKPLEQETAHYVTADKADTGIRCQLLNTITSEEANALLENDDYVMQEKHDGERMTLIKNSVSLTASNKKGLATGYPDVLNALLNTTSSFIIDGECIDEKFYAFDLLEFNGEDIRPKPYTTRLNLLQDLLTEWVQCNHVVFSITTYDTINKRAFYEQLLTGHKEGVVFKKKDASYIPGRPASKGTQLKYKFYSTASFIVGSVNTTKRSVGLLLYNSDVQANAGNVAIPVNADVPVVGSIVEVRYLYAFPESGSIYQPTYKGQRTDVSPEECVTSQLTYKPIPEKQ